MKYAGTLILLFQLALTHLSGLASGQSPIVVGISAPLTGESAVFGEDIRDVVRFARDYFDDKHIELDIQDDGCTGKGGASAAQYFIQKKARAVLGFACVESIMPAIPPLQKAGIPVISVLASGPHITGIGKNVFNLYPSDELGVKLIARRLLELSVSKVLVLTADSAFPVGITEAFKREIANSRLEVMYRTYPPNTTDFASIFLQTDTRKADAVFINYSSAGEFVSFLKERARLKGFSRVFTSYLNGYDAIKAQGDVQLIEGVEFYDTAPLEITLRRKDKSIYDHYLQENGHLKSSDGYFPFIFNGYVALRAALFRADGVADGLRAQTFENGVGGSFSFGPDGSVRGSVPFVLRIIENGVAVTKGEG